MVENTSKNPIIPIDILFLACVELVRGSHSFGEQLEHLRSLRADFETGNPKACGASISSQGLILTPDTSPETQVSSDSDAAGIP